MRTAQMFETNLRVRFSETDSLGVVYYWHYYTYFDLARLEMLRSVGINSSLLGKRGLSFVAAESSCRYYASARLDDVLTATVRIMRIGDNSVVYQNTIKKEKKVIADGRVIDVMVDRTGKPVKIPPDVKKRLSRYAK